MADLVGAARHAWRRLEGDWVAARMTWKGVTADRFEAHFWCDLETATREFQRELEHLEQALHEARASARR